MPGPFGTNSGSLLAVQERGCRQRTPRGVSDSSCHAAPRTRRQLASQRKTLSGRVSVCARLRPDPARLADPIRAAKLALRAVAERAQQLDRQARDLDRHLARLVARAAPRTTGLLGISTAHAGQLLVTAGQNLNRLGSEAAFAHLCAADPIPASSGKTTRHRLNPGGNRDAHTALHLIAVVRLRYCPRTRAYAARRTAQGLSKREIIRCFIGRVSVL
jgi:transposase